ncbi:hypothetical protein [Leptolyngbya sp. NIES-2104]|uniref:hypothetical protein n=1 Tax=Leptolyngbya sp. NIES-2104 TaxID=1552121 RepID=UPI0006EC89F0|nr:hypothetical protein [Leptolyngbya sp. NIES-2104]GAP93776.1 hypothetical protein NIES2104_02840 [Leptolyngbya sp. NIES-2104]
MTQQPDNTDAVLGGQSLPNSLILGGIEGLRQRFKFASSNQKMALLTDTLNYDAAGIDLLIDLLNDAELEVRVTAYELLALIDSEKATNAIAQGIRLNPGDHIYHVYESAIEYNDNWLELITEFDFRAEYNPPKWLSSHFVRDQAEAEALKHHQKRAYSLDLKSFGGRHTYREFDLEQWVIDHLVYARQPQETPSDFSERLRIIFEATGQTALLEQLWQNFQSENFDIDRWFASLSFSGRLLDETYWEFEAKIVKGLEALQSDEQLGELWIEAAGRLAFVQEETVTEVRYVDATEFL